MVSALFRAVLLISLQITLPLLLVYLCSGFFRDHVRSATFLKIKKTLLVGALLAFIPAYWGPLIKIQNLTDNISLPDLHIDLSDMIFEKEIILSGNDVISVVAPNRITIIMLFEGIWFCGMILYAYRTIQKNIQLIYSIQNIPKSDSPDIRDLCNELCREIGIKDPPPVILAPGSNSPKTVGWLQPVIILPNQSASLSNDNFKMLLLHELYHYKGKDNGWKLLSSIVFTVFWFHPLIRWLVFSFSIECELACDEKVLKGTSLSTKHSYSEMLIYFSSQKNPFVPPPDLQSGVKSSLAIAKLRMKQVYLSESKQSAYALLFLSILSVLVFGEMVGYTNSPVFLSASKTGPVNSLLAEVRTTLLETNPKGYIFEQRSQAFPPQDSFQWPIITDSVFNQKSEGNDTYRNLLCFLAIGENKTVVSACDGIISAIQGKDIGDLSVEELPLSPLGKYIIVDCGNGLSIRYTFLDSILVQPGQAVSAGDALGIAGHTGASYGDADQCGIYILQDGVMVDPLPYFDIDIPIEEIP